ncbi:MAG TPA: hypothetical protein VL832_18530 [Puia sp.]|nr:hypothetical protein [Puia sp.]
MSDKVYIDRYPGLRPFDEAEKMMFFGRALEVQSLFQSISVHDLFIIHGESGLGKSSLINAGLIPKLKEKGFRPFLIRFKEKETVSALDHVLKVMDVIEEEYKDQHQARSKEELLLYGLKKYNHAGVQPVLIFDQFEEFYYFNDEQQFELIKALAGLFEDKRQRDVRPEVKVVLCLRSDRLNIFEKFAEEIPTILRNRYPLKPISSVQVSQMIMAPALMEPFGDIRFKSPVFRPDLALIRDITEVVEDKKTRSIDTSQLQMICQEIEAVARKKNGSPIEITQEEMKGKEGLKELVRNFYTKQLGKIAADPRFSDHELSAIQLLIEDKLLVDSKRELMGKASVYQHFRDHRKKKKTVMDPDPREEVIVEGRIPELIDQMLGLRLIRDQQYFDSIFYEISHETLIGAIGREKQRRKIKEREAEDEERERERLRDMEEKRKQVNEAVSNMRLALEQRAKAEDQKKMAEQQRARAEDLQKKAEEERAKADQAVMALKETRLKLLQEQQRKLRMQRLAIYGLILICLGCVGGFLYIINRNHEKKILLAAVFGNEAEKNYHNGNHPLAYRLWKTAGEYSGDSYYINNLNKSFAVFAGKNISLSEDFQYVLTVYQDNSSHIWRRQGSTIQHLKRYPPGFKVNFFPNQDIAFVVDTAGTLRFFDLNRTDAFSFIKGVYGLDTLKKVKITFINGDRYFYMGNVRAKYFFSSARKMPLTRVNAFLDSLYVSYKSPDREAGQVYSLDSTTVFFHSHNHLYLIELDRQVIHYLGDSRSRYVTDFAYKNGKFAYVDNHTLKIFDPRRRGRSYSIPNFVMANAYYIIGFVNDEKELLIKQYLSKTMKDRSEGFIRKIDLETRMPIGHARYGEVQIAPNDRYYVYTRNDSLSVSDSRGDTVMIQLKIEIPTRPIQSYDNHYLLIANADSLCLLDLSVLPAINWTTLYRGPHGMALFSDNNTLIYYAGDSAYEYSCAGRRVVGQYPSTEQRLFIRSVDNAFYEYQTSQPEDTDPSTDADYALRQYILVFKDSAQNRPNVLQRYFADYLVQEEQKIVNNKRP